MQVYRRAVKRGFSFNLMLAGESGLGKASLINSMFLADVCQKKVIFLSSLCSSSKFLFSADDLWWWGPEPAREDGGGRGGDLCCSYFNLCLDNPFQVKLNLNVLDLPGFGDEIDNSK